MQHRLIALFFLLFFFIGNLWAQEFDTVDIHGFLSQGFMKSDANNFLADTEDGSFEFNEMGINFGTWVAPRLHMGLQLFARDLGDIGNDNIILNWAYADYHFKPWLGLRVGKIKIPFGLYNETRDFDMMRVNTFLPQSIYNEGFRDTASATKGFGVYGKLNFNTFGTILYQSQLGIMDIGIDEGVAKFMDGQADGTTTSIEAADSQVLAFQWLTPLQGLRIGATISEFKYVHHYTTNDGTYWRRNSIEALLTGANMNREQWQAFFGSPPSYADAQRFGADMVGLDIALSSKNMFNVLSIEYVRNNLTLSAEYGWDDVVYKMVAPPPFGLLWDDVDLTIEGYYGSMAYRLTDWCEMGAYYSEFYPNADDKSGHRIENFFDAPSAIYWLKDLALSTRFDINQSWTAKLEVHKMDGLAVMYIQDQTRNPDGSYNVDRNWMLFCAKLSYLF